MADARALNDEAFVDAEYSRLLGINPERAFRSDSVACSILGVSASGLGYSKAARNLFVKTKKFLDPPGQFHHSVPYEYKASNLSLTYSRAKDLLLCQGKRSGGEFKGLSEAGVFVGPRNLNAAVVRWAQGRIQGLEFQIGTGANRRRPTEAQQRYLDRYQGFIDGELPRTRSRGSAAPHMPRPCAAEAAREAAETARRTAAAADAEAAARNGAAAAQDQARHRAAAEEAARQAQAAAEARQRTAGQQARYAATAAAAAAEAARRAAAQDEARRAAQAADDAAAEARRNEAARLDAALRANPAFPERREPDLGAPFSAIDNVEVKALIVCEFGFNEELPLELHELWACAVHDSLRFVVEASTPTSTSEERDRALLWNMGLHQFLLRKPPKARGGRRSGVASVYLERFATWHDGRFDLLIDWWRRDLELTRAQERHVPDGSRDTEKALKLIQIGELSKACKVLSNTGLGDLGDPRIVAQMQRKNPIRKQEIRLTDADFDDVPDFKVNLAETYRGLRRRCGTGPNGLPNEYLIVLARSYDNAIAAETMGLVDAFQTRAVNGHLPYWWYNADASMTLVAPIKDPIAPLNSEGVQDCRPVGMGNTARRASAKLVQTLLKADCAEAFYPVQVCVGVSSGINMLAASLRESMLEHPGWVLIQVDVFNGFNEAARFQIISALLALSKRVKAGESEASFHRAGQVLARYCRAYLSPESLIVLSGSRPVIADFRSSEGMQQGDGLGMTGFAAMTQSANEELNAHLRAHVSLDPADGDARGFAPCYADDAFIFAPKEIAFEAARLYDEAIRPLGLALKAAGCKAYCPASGLGLADDPLFAERVSRSVEDGVTVARIDGIKVVEDGVKITGVFVGTTAYVQTALVDSLAEQRSYIENITSKLQSHHSQSLHAVVLHCLQQRADFAMANQFPEDSAHLLAGFDAAIERAVVAALGGAGAGVVSDAFAKARLQLPARLNGGGIRKRVKIAPAAFVSNYVGFASRLTDRITRGGAVIRGFAPHLDAIFGKGNFNDGATDCYAGLIESSAPVAVVFVDCWGLLQTEIREALLTDRIEAGPLSVSVQNIGTSPDGPIVKLQKAITEQREEAALVLLNRNLATLGPRDPRRQSQIFADRFSSSLVTSIPTYRCSVTNDEWAEMMAVRYGLPSPACAPYVGRRLLDVVLGEHGHELLSHPSFVNRKKAREDYHDGNLERLAAGLVEAYVPCSTEVFGLFAGVCAGGGAAARDSFRGFRDRSKVVPDMLWTDLSGAQCLGDVKTIANNVSNYGQARTLRAGKPVDIRAAKVNDEYDKHALALDVKFNRCPAFEVDPTTGLPRKHANGTKVASTTVGPVRALLRSFGPVKGFVFGDFGEASVNVHALLKVIAERIAIRHWKEMGARNANDAASALSNRFYREWGIGSMRGRARALLTQLDAVGEPRHAPSSCFFAAQARRQYAARQQAYVFRQGPYVQRPNRFPPEPL